MNLKTSTKIILSVCVLVLVLLFYMVFKSVNNYTEGADSAELADTTKVEKELSYLRNQDKNYIVEEYSSDENKKIKYIQRYNGLSKGYHTWWGTETLVEKENKYGLFYAELKVLAYPVEVGKEWTAGSYTFTIESVDETITVPTGTYKNVVKVKTIEKGVEGYTTSYFAKGVGQVLRESVDANSKKEIRYQLLKLENE